MKRIAILSGIAALGICTSLAATSRAQTPASQPAPGAAGAATPTSPETQKAVPPASEAEPLRAPNTIYGELLGPALLYSINYERLVIEDLGVRIGFSYWSVGGSVSSGGDSMSASAKFIIIPVTAS